jgi:hypothetical protein
MGLVLLAPLTIPLATSLPCADIYIGRTIERTEPLVDDRHVTRLDRRDYDLRPDRSFGSLGLPALAFTLASQCASSSSSDNTESLLLRAFMLRTLGWRWMIAVVCGRATRQKSECYEEYWSYDFRYCAA